MQKDGKDMQAYKFLNPNWTQKLAAFLKASEEDEEQKQEASASR